MPVLEPVPVLRLELERLPVLELPKKRLLQLPKR